MEKILIQNRKGQKVAVVLELSLDQKGLVFVMHGLSGFKEQPHIQTMAEAFLEKEMTVVRFDTTNTIGESDGKYEDATMTNYYEDLEDVIGWATDQNWYQEPFYLAGHSLGGLCTALYAENYPEKVRGLAPTSTVVSGELYRQTEPEEYWENWEQTGWFTKKSTSKPELTISLKWSFVEDILKFDLLEKVNQLTMPVLLVVGSEDTVTPLTHQKILFEKLPGKKELYIINGSTHTFREPPHLQELKEIFLCWINSVEKR